MDKTMCDVRIGREADSRPVSGRSLWAGSRRCPP